MKLTHFSRGSFFSHPVYGTPSGTNNYILYTTGWMIEFHGAVKCSLLFSVFPSFLLFISL
jgi:hypothetical protein